MLKNLAFMFCLVILLAAALDLGMREAFAADCTHRLEDNGVCAQAASCSATNSTDCNGQMEVLPDPGKQCKTDGERNLKNCKVTTSQTKRCYQYKLCSWNQSTNSCVSGTTYQPAMGGILGGGGCPDCTKNGS